MCGLCTISYYDPSLITCLFRYHPRVRSTVHSDGRLFKATSVQKVAPCPPRCSPPLPLRISSVAANKHLKHRPISRIFTARSRISRPLLPSPPRPAEPQVEALPLVLAAAQVTPPHRHPLHPLPRGTLAHHPLGLSSSPHRAQRRGRQTRWPHRQTPRQRRRVWLPQGLGPLVRSCGAEHLHQLHGARSVGPASPRADPCFSDPLSPV